MEFVKVTRSKDPEMIVRKVRACTALSDEKMASDLYGIAQKAVTGEIDLDQAIREREEKLAYVFDPEGEPKRVNWDTEHIYYWEYRALLAAKLFLSDSVPKEFNGEALKYFYRGLLGRYALNDGEFRKMPCSESKNHSDPAKIEFELDAFFRSFKNGFVDRAFRDPRNMAWHIASCWRWLGDIYAFEKENRVVEYALFEAACAVKGYDLAPMLDDMAEIKEVVDGVVRRGMFTVSYRFYDKLADMLAPGTSVADPELALKHVGDEAMKRQTAAEMLRKCVEKRTPPDEYKVFLLQESGELAPRYIPGHMKHGRRGCVTLDGDYIIRDLEVRDFDAIMERYTMAFEGEENWHTLRVRLAHDADYKFVFSNEYRGLVRILLDRGICLGAFCPDGTLAGLLLGFDYGAFLSDPDLFWMFFPRDKHDCVLYPGTIHRRIRCFLRDGRVQFLWAVSTKPEHRNRGIMKKLVDTWLDRDPDAIHCAFCYGDGSETWGLGDMGLEYMAYSDGARYEIMADRELDQGFDYRPELWEPEALEYRNKHGLVPAALNIKARMEREKARKNAETQKGYLIKAIERITPDTHVDPPWWRESSLEHLEQAYIKLARLDKLFEK